jgi:hypothetical protein
MKKPVGRPASRGPKAKPFSIRLEPAVRAALSKAGDAEQRPAAFIALRFIVDGLKAGGYLK